MIIFEYPNLSLYMGPFRRFTKLYFRNHPYPAAGKDYKHMNYTQSIVKLQLFEYAAFYR